MSGCRSLGVLPLSTCIQIYSEIWRLRVKNATLRCDTDTYQDEEKDYVLLPMCSVLTNLRIQSLYQECAFCLRWA
jgi:hypothetical protein